MFPSMLRTGMALAACTFAFTASADPYGPYRGTTLTVSWPTLGHFQKAEQLVQDFTEETGIEVVIKDLPFLDLREVQIAEMSKAEGTYDLVSWVIMWKGEYVSQGLLTPLAQFKANPALVDPSYDMADIAPAYLESGGIVGGDKGYLDGPGAALFGVPFGAETSILAYRKDIFQALGLEVPETYDELSAVIDRLETAGYSALTSRGAPGNHVTFAWLLHLSPLGGKIFDDAWQPQLTSPEAIEAAAFLRRVIETGPSGVESFGFAESALAFLQGNAAMYLDTLKIGAVSRDPNISMISEHVGFAPHPKGARCGSETGGFALGIPANSQNKEAAFLLLQYLTSKAGDQRMVELGGDPVRLSTMRNNVDLFPEYPVVVEQLACADPDWRPLIPEWTELTNEVLSPALTQVIQTNRPIEQIMAEANEKARAIMAAAGYYSWSSATN